MIKGRVKVNAVPAGIQLHLRVHHPVTKLHNLVVPIPDRALDVSFQLKVSKINMLRIFAS